jgi:hypothetical protein
MVSWFGLAELLILGLLADGLFRRLGVPGLIGMLAEGLLRLQGNINSLVPFTGLVAAMALGVLLPECSREPIV